jgi:hypothetical protein
VIPWKQLRLAWATFAYRPQFNIPALAKPGRGTRNHLIFNMVVFLVSRM